MAFHMQNSGCPERPCVRFLALLSSLLRHPHDAVVPRINPPLAAGFVSPPQSHLVVKRYAPLEARSLLTPVTTKRPKRLPIMFSMAVSISPSIAKRKKGSIDMDQPKPKQTLSPAAQAKMNAGNSAVRQRYAVGTTAQPRAKNLTKD